MGNIPNYADNILYTQGETKQKAGIGSVYL